MSTNRRNDIANALAILGDTADEVAARLCDADCFGCDGGYTCPVYKYLNKLLGLEWYTGTLAVVNVQTHEEVLYPTAVRHFILMFDSYQYPFLRLQ